MTVNEMPCEQFGQARGQEIDDLIQAATGSPCPGRDGGACPLALPAAVLVGAVQLTA